jgi:hypothetical protein
MCCVPTRRSNSMRPRASTARPSTSPHACRRRPRRPDRRRGASRSTSPTRSRTRPSPTAGDRRGNLPLLPRRADPARRPHPRRARRAEPRHRLYSEDEVEALQTTAMVIAEMIAAGGWSTVEARRPLDLAGRCTASGHRSPTASASAMSSCTSRASSITNLIAEDPAARWGGSRRPSRRCACRVDDMLERGDVGRRRAPRRARGLPHVRA